MKTHNNYDLYAVLFIIFATFMTGFMVAKAIYDPLPLSRQKLIEFEIPQYYE